MYIRPSNKKFYIHSRCNKYFFSIKRILEGKIDCYKARLIAKGFHQQSDVDFHETFSPIVKSTTIPIILSLALSSVWFLWQLDVNNAFLQRQPS